MTHNDTERTDVKSLLDDMGKRLDAEIRAREGEIPGSCLSVAQMDSLANRSRAATVAQRQHLYRCPRCRELFWSILDRHASDGSTDQASGETVLLYAEDAAPDKELKESHAEVKFHTLSEIEKQQGQKKEHKGVKKPGTV